MIRRGPERRGASMLEVVIGVVILSLALVPLLSLFMSSRRVGYSAKRLLDVSVNAQTVLEALSGLEESDYPMTFVPGSAQTILDDDYPVATSGKPRFDQIAKYFFREPGPPLKDMKRQVQVERLAGGELFLKFVVEWEGIIGEQGTLQTTSLTMLSTPRNWR